MSYTILLVEDDQDLSAITKANLVHAGHHVETAFTCAQAEEALAKNSYDILLLDVMLPDGRGDQICRRMQPSGSCPVIFLSCLEDSDTVVGALRGGGDDYMVKPVRYPELLARIDAVVRRAQNRQSGQLRSFRSFQLDIPHHRILRDGQGTDLSSIEFDLLRYMIARPGTLLLYQDLYQNIWDADSLGDVRTVMVHISNLRKKVDPDHKGIITTVRRAGYIFSDV